MSFSWWCEDKAGKDLFDEFDINSQALGLDFDGSPNKCDDIRRSWIAVHYKDKFEGAAMDAVIAIQGLVRENLEYYEKPVHHLDCSSCTCKWSVEDFGGLDPRHLEHLRRFLTIPPSRAWRAGGGY